MLTHTNKKKSDLAHFCTHLKGLYKPSHITNDLSQKKKSDKHILLQECPLNPFCLSLIIVVGYYLNPHIHFIEFVQGFLLDGLVLAGWMNIEFDYCVYLNLILYEETYKQK